MATLTPVTSPLAAISTGNVSNGSLDMAGFAITNIAAPALVNDAARLLDTQGIKLPVYNANGVVLNVALSK